VAVLERRFCAKDKAGYLNGLVIEANRIGSNKGKALTANFLGGQNSGFDSYTELARKWIERCIRNSIYGLQPVAVVHRTD